MLGQKDTTTPKDDLMPEDKQDFQRFECTTNGSNKFWEVWKHTESHDGSWFYYLTTRWGKIGCDWGSKEKMFLSEPGRDFCYNRKVTEKIKKGYSLVKTGKTKFSHLPNPFKTPVIDKVPVITMSELEYLCKAESKKEIAIVATEKIASTLDAYGWTWASKRCLMKVHWPIQPSSWYILHPSEKTVTYLDGDHESNALWAERHGIELIKLVDDPLEEIEYPKGKTKEKEEHDEFMIRLDRVELD